MWTAVACRAVREARRVRLVYRGVVRVAEVHAVGTSEAGEVLMRVWQVRGGSRGGEGQGWKLLRLDAVSDMDLLEERSAAPRPDFEPADPAMAAIVCRAG